MLEWVWGGGEKGGLVRDKEGIYVNFCSDEMRSEIIDGLVLVPRWIKPVASVKS